MNQDIEKPFQAKKNQQTQARGQQRSSSELAPP
jgi:hypothetical protein